MLSQRSSNTDSSLSEFSSTLLDVNSKNLDEQDTVVDISSNGYESLENNHLSSVLSQIQDDGPAYEESIKSKKQSDQMGKASVASISPDNQQNNLPKQ